EILDVYERSDFAVEIKGDGSPLTQADRGAHRLILSRLSELTPDIPVLSEESSEEVFSARTRWNRMWLVDPLDGTKEFVKRNGEFTVNIALLDAGNPVMGVVHTPVKNISHFAETGKGAFRSDSGQSAEQISVRKLDPAKAVMVASRSHAGPAVEAYRNNLAQQVEKLEIASMGSSLKLCLVAEGQADIYPRLGPTSEWDTAAAHCVVKAAGGSVTRIDGTALSYNKKNILNPWFLVGGDPDFDWTIPAKGIVEI
ncbi:MAG: 3'(2'),5'-bisphosphate nucleotidase CysQ, partial [bacterium]